MSVAERAGPLACSPEMATLNCGTLNFGDDVFVNTRPQIRELARRIRAAGSLPELECYEAGHIDEALSLVREGELTGPLHFNSCWACQGALARAKTSFVSWRLRSPRGRAGGWPR